MKEKFESMPQPHVVYKQQLSPREQVAQDICAYLVFADLSQVYAGGYSKLTDKKGKSYYSIPFCRARTVDGIIKVYSERWIAVSWVTSYRNLPPRTNTVYKNQNDLKAELTAFFVR